MKKDGNVYGDHISQTFNDELAQLKSLFLEMGGLVEAQTTSAVRAIITQDTELATQIRLQEKAVDRYELEIDERAIQILALRQPAARDLRLVVSVIKAVSDLERVGDEAKKIAKLALQLAESGRVTYGQTEIRHLGQQVTAMLNDALDAFARLDVDKAVEIIRKDKEVDAEYKTAARSMMTYMMEDPRTISECMTITWVFRSLERVGDHACNLAELVVYMSKGEDVRHTKADKLEERLGRTPDTHT